MKNVVKYFIFFNPLFLLRSLLLIGIFTFCIVETFGQQRILSGKITLEDQTPLPGASIMIKGTTIGTISDLNGDYSISVPVTADTLVIRFVGMESQEIKISSSNIYNVTLSEGSLSLDEIVVVGYGTQKKESLVGSISTVKGDDLVRAGGLTNISSSLTGLVPGLVTFNTIGKPGADQADILIRGKTTWNNASPLILVDGIERNMDDIEVSDVESISVLKDASATAVFGVRGANGVILITTKRGKTGKPTFRISTNHTMKQISKIAKYANSYESLWLRNKAIELQVPVDELSWGYYVPYENLIHYKDQDLPYLFPDVNWQDAALRKTAWSQNYVLDSRGGTNFVKYFSSLAYTYDGDIIKSNDYGQGYKPTNDFRRVNFRTNLDFQPTKSTKFSIDMDGSFGKENSFGSSFKVWEGVYGKAPELYPIMYEDGIFGYSNITDAKGVNPIHEINFSGLKSKTTSDFNTTFKLEQKLNKITEGLSLQALATFQNIYHTSGPLYSGNPVPTKYIDPYTGLEEITYPPAYTALTHGFNYVQPVSVVSIESSVPQNLSRNLMYQTSLNYMRKFAKHTVSGLALFKRQERTIGNEFTHFREEWAGRAVYDFDTRYIFETNMAYNGSEQFGPGYKFGFFPSFAIGWNLGYEDFFQNNVKFINMLKFRFSRGKVGNDNLNLANARWLYSTSWEKLGNAQFGNINPSKSPYQIIREAVIGNPDLKWETAVKNDFAVEIGFLDNMFRFNLDYYWGKREDIFMAANQRNIPPWFGMNPVPGNIGQTKDHGWEFEAVFNKSNSSGFRYYVNFSLSYAINEIIFMEDPYLLPAYQKKEGFPIGQNKTQFYTGIINSWDELYTGVMGTENSLRLPGDFRMLDYNADGVIDSYDVVPYGYPGYPLLVSNYTIGANFKGWGIMMQFYNTRNSTLYQEKVMWGGSLIASVDRVILDGAWIPGRENEATFSRPLALYNDPGSGQFNNVDGTMWRLKTAEISYELSDSFLKNIGISNFRIFINGNNLWLWSHLNEDRERATIRNNTANEMFDRYPMTKRVNFGLNISF